MEAMPYAPGDGSVEPLPAQGPVPPGSDIEEVVDALDDRIREAGPDEVEAADEKADRAEAEARPDGEPSA
jgi:hypothetical protein